MKKPSIEFQNRLARIFDDRLRVRWSTKRGEWHVEYKIAPGQLAKFPVNSWDDDAIRAKDGYAFILAVREGDRMPCPKCGCTLKVPLFKMAEVKCEYCKLQGYDGRYPACFFPLEGDALITYLAKLDPQRGWRDNLAKQADAANERLLAQRERDFENTIEAATKDNINDLFQIPRVGFGGMKRFTGDS